MIDPVELCLNHQTILDIQVEIARVLKVHPNESFDALLRFEKQVAQLEQDRDALKDQLNSL